MCFSPHYLLNWKWRVRSRRKSRTRRKPTKSTHPCPRWKTVSIERMERRGKITDKMKTNADSISYSNQSTSTDVSSVPPVANSPIINQRLVDKVF